MPTTILSWNVNGYRAALKNGFMDWLTKAKPDILCLQETRALPSDLKPEDLEPQGYNSYWNPAAKRGYSGTATMIRAKREPKAVYNMGLEHFDNEGRLQVLEFDTFTILNGYWPNAQPERKRLDFKLEFVDEITDFANKLDKKGHDLIICGDLNIAHTEIDLARPKDNQNSPGFYPEEREAMERFLSHGYIDTFRHKHPKKIQYSWWSYRTRARERNIGWRIDYHCVNKRMADRIKKAWILDDVYGSDHCPVGLKIE